METSAGPEKHRDYFRRELQVGRRIVCEWSVLERWPNYPLPYREIVFDGFEFRTEEDANRFNLDALTGSADYDLDSWDQAVAWVQEDPTSETRNVQEQLEEAREKFLWVAPPFIRDLLLHD